MIIRVILSLFLQINKDYKLNYEIKLIFATDPVTPSKLINDFNNNIDLDLIGTSGKVTAFFKNPVRWKDSNNYSDSFRFIFSVDSLNSFEDASQNALKDLDNYFPGTFKFIQKGVLKEK